MPKWDLSLPPDFTVPRHIGIIPDGNRRWARARGLPTLEGHRRGFDAAVEVSQAAFDLGVHTVSVWCFSTENWNRSSEEVAYLMRLYELFLKKQLKNAKDKKIRIVHCGRKDRLPKSLANALSKVENDTKLFDQHLLNICLDYGGRDEIARAVQKIISAKIDSSKITPELIDSFVDTANQPHPHPDLIIRTSGEQRLSGFLSWQNAYSEFYFEKDHFPDFNPAKLINTIIDFNHRSRRFGK